MLKLLSICTDRGRTKPTRPQAVMAAALELPA